MHSPKKQRPRSLADGPDLRVPHEMDLEKMPMQMRQHLDLDSMKEARTAQKNAIHITALPLTMQRDRAEYFDSLKKKKG